MPDQPISREDAIALIRQKQARKSQDYYTQIGFDIAVGMVNDCPEARFWIAADGRLLIIEFFLGFTKCMLL